MSFVDICWANYFHFYTLLIFLSFAFLFVFFCWFSRLNFFKNEWLVEVPEDQVHLDRSGRSYLVDCNKDLAEFVGVRQLIQRAIVMIRDICSAKFINVI